MNKIRAGSMAPMDGAPRWTVGIVLIIWNPNENARIVDAGNGVCRLLRSRGKLSLEWADDSYLTMQCIGVGNMNSARQFATSAKSIKELSAPFREALIERVRETECIKYLIFSPSYGTANFQTLASVLCLTNRRWLVVHSQDDGSATIVESSYDSTLLVEVTLILLYGQLKIDFAQAGKAISATLHFNSVMEDTYSEAIQYILDAIDGPEIVAGGAGRRGSPIFGGWPLKFRNFSILYLPKKSQLLDGVCWKEIRGGFGRELAPAAAVLVTDRHIVVIAEEKTSRWFQFRHHAKYGAIITYFPLNRLANLRVELHPRFCILELDGYEAHGGERLGIVFPPEKREAVSRLLGKTRPNRVPVSPEKLPA
jgi:hypothetical protein